MLKVKVKVKGEFYAMLIVLSAHTAAINRGRQCALYILPLLVLYFMVFKAKVTRIRSRKSKQTLGVTAK